MITGIKCPYCNKPMHLTMGNLMFSYWICKNCNKEFEYNVFQETFTAEAPAQDRLLKEMDGRK